ncbi:MAG TPA: quercetin 2,3-dioxygenase [Amycolatopsis sp.]|uniref:quercetin 2,3-dioxygenase n=1 Tax=Amycolatopsis sp. TaxID=37632 RepID=UPI002B466080|nr:quercetin 2,3-dioxygenase [Amycolatopsis sp.]HKS49119.1 quercetin 2,3-dioxygenase [Amycolatopsis sp.]
MSLDLEHMHKRALLRNQLPGEPAPYFMAGGEGKRYEVDGQLWTVFARALDTGGLFDAAFVNGGRGARTGYHTHRDHQRSFLVVDGTVQAWLGNRSRILMPGDSLHVPPGTPVAYRMLAHNTRLLVWAAPGGALDYIEKLGLPVGAHIHPARPQHRGNRQRRAELGGPLGITFPQLDEVRATDEWDAKLPTDASPYFLRAGEGDRLAAPNALNTYVVRGINTGNRYFAVSTLGGPGRYFLMHFHREHTETFLCLSGRTWLYINGEEVLLTRGDFVHAPAGTIHTFAFDAHNTHMLGILAPDIFERFFEIMGRPTEDHVYDETKRRRPDGAPPAMAVDDLDLVVVGPPPERELAVGV